MDEKVAERLDAWWAGQDDQNREEIMDRVGTAFHDATLLTGLRVEQDYIMARWSEGDGPWTFHLKGDARDFAQRRADLRDFKRMTD